MYRFPHVACAVLLSLLAACGGGHRQEAATVAFPPAPLPMYSPGDSYTFDDGTVDSVVAVTNDEVRWRSGTGARFATARDVLLPPVSWTDATLHGRRSLSGLDALFPLQPSGKMDVTAAITEQRIAGGPPMIGQENWQCQVSEAQRTQVAAGSFDTVRVDCVSTEQPGGRRVQRSYFYAPTIGYYVRRIDRVGDAPPRTVDLAAWTEGNPPLPDTALQQRVSAIQRSLEGQASGAVVSWQDQAAQVAGSVEPVRTLRGDDGRWCRDFQEHVEAFGRRYTLIGAACRDTAGGWQVVNVAPFRAATR